MEKTNGKKSASTTELDGVLRACIYAAAMRMAKTGKDPEALDADDDNCLNAILLAISERAEEINMDLTDPTAQEYMGKVYGEFVGMEKSKEKDNRVGMVKEEEEDSDDDSLFGEGDTTKVVLSGNKQCVVVFSSDDDNLDDNDGDGSSMDSAKCARCEKMLHEDAEKLQNRIKAATQSKEIRHSQCVATGKWSDNPNRMCITSDGG